METCYCGNYEEGKLMVAIKKHDKIIKTQPNKPDEKDDFYDNDESVLPQNQFECTFMLDYNNKFYMLVLQSYELEKIHPIFKINQLLAYRALKKKPKSILILFKECECAVIDYVDNYCDTDVNFKFTLSIKDMTETEKEIARMKMLIAGQQQEINDLKAEIKKIRVPNILPYGFSNRDIINLFTTIYDR